MTYFKKICALLLITYASVFFAYASNASLDREILQAASRGDVAILKDTLARGANPDARDRLGNTPLILACDAGYQEIVRLLISNNAAINSVNKYGYTPLLSAVANRHRYIASLLVKAGANPKIKNIYGTDAEDLIKTQGFFTIGEYTEGTEPAITSILDYRDQRRGELGAIHNEPWREKFNKLISENKSAEATEYLVQIALQDNYEAAFLLGALLIERNQIQKGIDWLKISLKSENADVLYNAAKILSYVDDGKEAIDANIALKKAMKKGNTLAETEYAKNLLIGNGTPIDNKEAYNLFKNSADKGVPEALYYKGYMKFSGIGTTHDETEGLEIIKQAATLGYFGAQIFIDKLEADKMIKRIADYSNDNSNELKTYLVSMNALPMENEEGCEAYNLTNTTAMVYKIEKFKICLTNGSKNVTFYLSTIINKDETEYLKNISGNANFITE